MKMKRTRSAIYVAKYTTDILVFPQNSSSYFEISMENKNLIKFKAIVRRIITIKKIRKFFWRNCEKLRQNLKEILIKIRRKN